MDESIQSEDTAELARSAVSPPLRVVACAARTDRGKRRRGNEDAVLVAAPLLADGVGGHRAGEEASAVAIDVCAGGWRGSELSPSKRCEAASSRPTMRFVPRPRSRGA